MQPMNYIINTGNPANAFSQGAEQTLGLMGAVNQQRLLQQKAEQQRIANEQAVVRQQRFQEVALNPTAGAVQKLMIEFPELSEQFKRSYDSLNDSEKEDAIATSYSVVSALKQGRADVAKAELDRKIEAAKNAGDAGRVQKYQMLRDGLVASPEGTLFGLQGLLFAGMGGEKYAQAVSTLDKNEREAELQPSVLKESEAKAEKAAVAAKFAEETARAGITEKMWNVRNLQNQIAVRGAQLKIDRERLAVETAGKMAEIKSKLTEIPAGSQKLVNDAAVTAGAAKQQAETYDDLANRITSIGSSWGAAGSANEWLKKAAGMQDGVTALRQEYTRLRNSAAVASLPPGPATDKDIQMVLEGFPPPNASPQVLSGFLRGMAKLKDVEAAVEGAKVDWLANNRGVLTRANQGFRAGDFSVEAGESFTDFSAKVAKEVSKKYAPTPQPASSQANSDLLRQADAIISGVR